ncbi:TetR/AcrR family transcriptional regulator [Brevibacterium yomogidense]|uniref:TetR/AcrR family transcriptional regulator n=1 Tax=Brevibacterium yomogidense TaxID=946573 RepID=UPI000B36046F|nr:TetR/AcrR family transcriptional regulator [Brevibacterium yomogidense]
MTGQVSSISEGDLNRSGGRAAKPALGRPRELRIDHAVLREALVEISTRGLRNLRITAIADRAGVSKASIYSRWPTRECLITAALTVDNFVATKPCTGTLRGDLRYIISQWAEMYRDPVMLNLFTQLDADRSHYPEIVETYVQKVRSPANKAVEDVISTARDRGELRDGVDIGVTARVIVGSLRFQTQLDGPVSTRFERMLLDFVWNAIAKDASGTESAVARSLELESGPAQE